MFRKKSSLVSVFAWNKRSQNLCEICFAFFLLPWTSIELCFRSHFRIFASFAGTWPSRVFTQIFSKMVIIIIQKSYIFKHSVFRMADNIFRPLEYPFISVSEKPTPNWYSQNRNINIFVLDFSRVLIAPLHYMYILLQ